MEDGTNYINTTHIEKLQLLYIQVDAQNAAALRRATNINIEQIFVEILYGVAATVFCRTPSLVIGLFDAYTDSVEGSDVV